jgi:hypothetical protein
MSKIVGASFIALGTGGIALALLKDTKYDPLIRLGITKPKIVSKVQQDFHCEVLFLKIATNYFQKNELQKQIGDLYTSPDGISNYAGYQLNDATKKRVAELEAQKDKVEKLYLDALSEYKNSICGQEMDAMECIGGGNCLKTTEFKVDCVNNGIAYFTEYNIWKDVDADLKNLSNAEFQKKYDISLLQKDPKSYHRTNLPIKLKKIDELKKAYDSCDVANVDCETLKEDIATLKEQYDRYKADPDSNRQYSPARTGMIGAKRDLEIKQQIFDKANCGSRQIVRTGVNYKDVRDCIQLDVSIKDYKDEILTREKKKLELGSLWTSSSETRLNKFKDETKDKENDFINKGCKGRLESEKLKDNAITLTEMSSQQESNVLKKNVTEQYAYIGIGALVLLTGFYMVLKK